MEKAFKALASNPRRRILNHLAGGPMTVGEVASKFDMAMPSISKHISVLHVDLEKDITPFRLMEALNAHLRPDPVAVTACEAVGNEWHARFSCIGRSYLYRIANRRAPLTFDKNRAWQIPQDLDAAEMHQAAQALVGRHETAHSDLRCFHRPCRLRHASAACAGRRRKSASRASWITRQSDSRAIA